MRTAIVEQPIDTPALIAEVGRTANGATLVFIGTVAGFLWFNLPRARIFLGDAGSTFLGFFLGVASLRAGFGDEGPQWAWAAPLCVLAVPLYDMTSVVLIRLRQRRSPFQADEQHLSHRLVERGLSSPAAVGVTHLAALASGLCGLLLYYVSTAIEAALVGGGPLILWMAFAACEFFIRHSAAAKETPNG